MRAASPTRSSARQTKSTSGAAKPRPALVSRQRLKLDPIITMDAGGTIQSASDSVESVFGWTPGELFGRNMKALIPEPRRSSLDRYLDRCRNADNAKSLQRTRRFDGLRKDGKVIQIELSISRAELPAHSAPFFIGIVRDVSSEIEVGPEMAGERARLHLLITEQTRALATANLRLHLADRLASIGTLAAGLGHDMNNVLLPVRARLNAIEHGGLNAVNLRHLDAVRQSMAYLQHLSDGLHFLALDPYGPGVGSDGEGVTDLVSWWSNVGDLLRKSIPKHVTLSATFPKGLPPIRIAPHWLTQAVLNLIVNAGESIPSTTRRGLIRVWAEPGEGGMVRLGVADNGRGMTRETLRHAFDLFFTTKSRGMGTGLGLPLVRKVAVRAGGDAEITSTPGKGTAIVLRLMTAQRKAVVESTRHRTAAITVHDQRAASLITQIISSAGVQVRAGRGSGPGEVDLWVVEPSASSPAAATRWRKKHPLAKLVLLGAPAKRVARQWAAIRPQIIETPEDFEAVRRVLGLALRTPAESVPNPSKGKAKS